MQRISSATTTHEPAPESESDTAEPGLVRDPDTSAARPPEIVEWLVECGPRLVEHWIHELRAREMGSGNGADRVVEMFAHEIVRMLPLTIGPYRDQIRPLWDRAAGLYGAVAAKRGLAAGEAIEELHVLRELVIRELYRNPPGSCSVPLSLREFLRLSRSLDRAVTHTSVGHTDALFFEFFEGDGSQVGVLSGDDVAGEARAQLDEIRDELREVLRHGPWSLNGGAEEH